MNDTDTLTADPEHDTSSGLSPEERQEQIDEMETNAPEEPVDVVPDCHPDLCDAHAGDALKAQEAEEEEVPTYEVPDTEVTPMPTFDGGEDPCTMVGPEDPDWNEIMEELCDTEVSSDGPHENPAYDEGDSGTADEDAAQAEQAAEVVAVPDTGSNAAGETAEVTVVAQPVDTLPETGAEVALAGVGIVLALSGAALVQVARRLASR